jgi:hypothetical protein
MTTQRWWFPVHSVINGILAMALILAAFEVALTNFHRGFTSPHRVRFGTEASAELINRD